MNPDQETYAKSKTGSPYYMAPELFQDDGVYSFASDLWSFGCILFEFLTGKAPFNSSSLNKLIKMIQDEPVPLYLLSATSDCKDLITQLLEKDPVKRISWDELINHPYWGSDGDELKTISFPPQPQFEEYLRNRGIDPEHYLIHKDNKFAKKLLQPYNPKNMDIMRLSYNVKKNMDATNYGEDQTKNDDIMLNNQNIELDFADENEDDEAAQTDEYSTPLERQTSDPPIKTFKNSNVDNIIAKPSKVTTHLSDPLITEPNTYDMGENNLFDENKPLETEEFKSDSDDNLKVNLIHVEKRDFKHLSNISSAKPRKLVSAHSDVDNKVLDPKFFDSNNDDTDEKQSNKLALHKNKSIPITTKQPEVVIPTYTKPADKKQILGFSSTGSKTALMNKVKLVKTSAFNKEMTKSPNTIKFYPGSSAKKTVSDMDGSDQYISSKAATPQVFKPTLFQTVPAQTKKM